MAKTKVPIRTIYYSDELNDDFAATNGIKQKQIDKNYNYFREKNVFVKILSAFLYYIIAKPIVYILLKIVFRFKVINKKVMKKRGKKGCFIYSNHTHYLPDAALNSFTHRGRNYIIVGSQVVNIKGLNNLVQSLGAIPLGDTIDAKMNFLRCIDSKLKKNASITIYPEAHIWPYYTKIRNFSNKSFRYPVNLNVPVFSTTTCYTKTKHLSKPKIIFVIDGPFYPDTNLSKEDAMSKLRDQVYDAMAKATSKYSNYQYIEYIKKK